MLSKREEYIKNFFTNNFSENESVNIVKKISEIGESLGYLGVNLSNNEEKNNKRKHKYDVWIAKEAKKNINILDRIVDLRLIIDWAYETKIDLFSYTFEEAFEGQSVWHLEMLSKYDIQKVNIPEIDENRIVFRFSDKKHFLYLLNAEELKYEGKSMGHCVGGTNYKQKIKNGLSLILSIRDIKNQPHVTIEIDVPSKTVIQQQGRGNSEPTKKYKNMIKEFLFFSTNFKDLDNKEILKFLNANF